MIRKKKQQVQHETTARCTTLELSQVGHRKKTLRCKRCGPGMGWDAGSLGMATSWCGLNGACPFRSQSAMITKLMFFFSWDSRLWLKIEKLFENWDGMNNFGTPDDQRFFWFVVDISCTFRIDTWQWPTTSLWWLLAEFIARPMAFLVIGGSFVAPDDWDDPSGQ